MGGGGGSEGLGLGEGGQTSNLENDHLRSPPQAALFRCSHFLPRQDLPSVSWHLPAAVQPPFDSFTFFFSFSPSAPATY